MTLAHLAGLPLEELLALAPAAGASWLALRAALAPKLMRSARDFRGWIASVPDAGRGSPPGRGA
jgi:hypothetical protein